MSNVGDLISRYKNKVNNLFYLIWAQEVNKLIAEIISGAPKQISKWGEHTYATWEKSGKKWEKVGKRGENVGKSVCVRVCPTPLFRRPCME